RRRRRRPRRGSRQGPWRGRGVIQLSLGEIAEITGGTLQDAAPGAAVTGPVVHDSRAVRPGALFVAIRGERVDGHDCATAAVAAGAAGVLAERRPEGPGSGRPGVSTGVPAVVVDDVLTALGLLARAVLARLPQAVVLGVTGSSGKTSTKDLIAQV